MLKSNRTKIIVLEVCVVFEIWKPIVGWEGLYEISNFGRVKSLSRKVKRGNYFLTIKEKILKTGYDDINRPRTMLARNGEKKYLHISRLVYRSFNGEIPEGMQVDHINRDQTDNKPKNLRACTPSQNSMNREIKKGAAKGADGKYKAKIYLGSFDSKEEAYKAYDRALELLVNHFPLLQLQVPNGK
jgi:hypothetical protein